VVLALVVAATLAVPAYGVGEKVWTGALLVLDPSRSLAKWGGDLFAYVPYQRFFAQPSWAGAGVAVAAIAVLGLVGLRSAPRALALGLGATIAFGVLGAVYFRHRHFGWYFEFKLLAFVVPLLLVCAAVGAARLRVAGKVALALLLAGAVVAGRHELLRTGFQLGEPTVALGAWDRSLPPGASVRLDMWPPRQLWAGYFLAGHRLCSQLPLLGSDYPHVAVSRKADYIVVERALPRPADAVGRPLRANEGWVLYRMSPAVPGPEHCSRRMIQPTDRNQAY
jgi:hypothetical protein